MYSSPNAVLNDALTYERQAMSLIAKAHMNTRRDDRLTCAFKAALSHAGKSALIVRDLENYLRNQFKKEFEPFYSGLFEDLEKDAPTAMRASEMHGTYER